MDRADQIAIVRSMTESALEDSDETLLTYLLMAGQEIINRVYPYDADTVTEVPSQYGFLQCRMAAYMLNKRGAEGETIHIENGVHRQYSRNDFPKEMLSQITPMVGVL